MKTKQEQLSLRDQRERLISLANWQSTGHKLEGSTNELMQVLLLHEFSRIVSHAAVLLIRSHRLNSW